MTTIPATNSSFLFLFPEPIGRPRARCRETPRVALAVWSDRPYVEDVADAAV